MKYQMRSYQNHDAFNLKAHEQTDDGWLLHSVNVVSGRSEITGYSMGGVQSLLVTWAKAEPVQYEDIFGEDDE